MIDLHTHSTASDGSLSPSELILYAKKKNLQLIALTDHDTIAGINEARNTALKENIEFVPGIELTIQRSIGEFHLLGLGLYAPSKSLLDIVAFLQEERKSRNSKIIKKLKNFNFKIDFDEFIAKNDIKSIGRPHFAKLLVEYKIVKTRQQAFDIYLAKNRSCYVEHQGANLDEAIIAIKESQGCPVIAHPLSLYITLSKMPNTLTELYEKGVEGLEAWHPSCRVAESQRLEAMAREIGFFITAGSDFHGKDIRPDRSIGKTAGKKPISNNFWEQELKPNLHNNKF